MLYSELVSRYGACYQARGWLTAQEVKEPDITHRELWARVPDPVWMLWIAAKFVDKGQLCSSDEHRAFVNAGIRIGIDNLYEHRDDWHPETAPIVARLQKAIEGNALSPSESRDFRHLIVSLETSGELRANSFQYRLMNSCHFLVHASEWSYISFESLQTITAFFAVPTDYTARYRANVLKQWPECPLVEAAMRLASGLRLRGFLGWLGCWAGVAPPKPP